MKGFTLIETIISIAVFSLIVVIISSVIMFGDGVYGRSRRSMELMQNGRVALGAMTREIRQAERIVTSLPEEGGAAEEIVFKDGHLEELIEKGSLRGGEGNQVILDNDFDGTSSAYRGSYLKITDGPIDLVGEIRKIVDFDEDSGRVYLQQPLSEDYSYSGLDYMIDTSNYYVRYYSEGGNLKREVFAYYYPGDPNYYLPKNSTVLGGEILERDILEIGIISEHVEGVYFWSDGLIHVSLWLREGGRDLNLIKKVHGRNL